MDAYFGITAHYVGLVDGEWRLQEDLIGFKLMRGSHTGANLAAATLDVLKDFRIINKVR